MVVDEARIKNRVIVLGGEGTLKTKTKPDFSPNCLVLENPAYFS